jgi:hypothetical protein
VGQKRITLQSAVESSTEAIRKSFQQLMALEKSSAKISRENCAWPEVSRVRAVDVAGAPGKASKGSALNSETKLMKDKPSSPIPY